MNRKLIGAVILLVVVSLVVIVINIAVAIKERRGSSSALPESAGPAAKKEVFLENKEIVLPETADETENIEELSGEQPMLLN